MNTAVYIGGGADFIPLKALPCKTFIYIDAEPNLSQYNDSFIPKIYYKLHMNKFKLKNKENNMHLFTNLAGVEVRYYTNYEFGVYRDAAVEKVIASADTLICCGHDPCGLILDICDIKTFVGNNDTIYSIVDNVYVSVCERLLDDPSLIRKYIKMEYPKDYYLMDIAPYVICRTISNFDELESKNF